MYQLQKEKVEIVECQHQIIPKMCAWENEHCHHTEATLEKSPWVPHKLATPQVKASLAQKAKPREMLRISALQEIEKIPEQRFLFIERSSRGNGAMYCKHLKGRYIYQKGTS